MRRFVELVSVVVIGGAALSGCSFSVGGDLTVPAKELEGNIASKLEKAGEKPQSVTCQGDLKGTVGATTDCEVVFTTDNTLEAHVKATKVDGSTVSYDTSPALTKEQLEKQVNTMISQKNDFEIRSVSCQSGLEGVEGTTVDCAIDTTDETLQAVAKVTKVDGLSMNFEVNPA